MKLKLRQAIDNALSTLQENKHLNEDEAEHVLAKLIYNEICDEFGYGYKLNDQDYFEELLEEIRQNELRKAL